MMNTRLIQYSLKYSLTFILIMMLSSGMHLQTIQAASPATLKYGNSGKDVPDLQYRLQSMGYFKAGITSYFGPVTREALIQFQRDYGIQVDGIAGPQTWTMLKKVSVNRYEMDMLAKIIYAEARGESYEGQVAVGAVVLNRLASSEFPDSIREVIEQPLAFTAVADGQYKMKPNNIAYLAALDAVRGYDPTEGALYYFNPDVATSKWIWTRKQTGKIGRHIFAV